MREREQRLRAAREHNLFLSLNGEIGPHSRCCVSLAPLFALGNHFGGITCGSGGLVFGLWSLVFWFSNVRLKLRKDKAISGQKKTKT